MNIRVFETREGWLNGRLGKVTGSSLKETMNLRDGETKAGVWRAAAESIIGSAAIAEADLSSAQILERGHTLEPEAIKRFEKETGKKVKRGFILWEHDEDSRIAVSPDGMIGQTAAVEVKCLLSPKHTEALFNRKIPKNTGGYEEQAVQYFIVNEKLKTLYYVFYHPDFPAPTDFFYLTFTRKELKADIDRFLAAEREAVAKVREIVNALSLYSPEEMAKARAVREELMASSAAEHRSDVGKITRAVAANRVKV